MHCSKLAAEGLHSSNHKGASTNNYLAIPPYPKQGVDINPWDYISKPAFWFLLVSEPQKPIKTNKNQETGKLGNPGPISQKPHMSSK